MNDEPWSEQEKCFLLAEILKTSLPSEALIRLIDHHHVRPNWPEVILPKGRNLRSCQEVYNYLSGSPPAFSSIHPPQPYSRPPPELHRKRHFHADGATTTGRMIAPKPSTFQPEPGAGSSYAMPPMNEPPVKKKRGRPTKAELEARQMSALAAGQVQPYSTPGPPIQQPSIASPLTVPAEGPVSSSSSTGNVPSGVRPTTPGPTGSDMSVQDSSASKKKRGRSNKAELDLSKHGAGAQESPAKASPPILEPRPPSGSAVPSAAPENRADDIQDRMRVEKFMREHP